MKKIIARRAQLEPSIYQDATAPAVRPARTDGPPIKEKPMARTVTPLMEWVTKMTDREIKDDYDLVVSLAEPELQLRLKEYRRLRMAAPGFLPHKPGSNSHKNIKGRVRTKRSPGRACVCGNTIYGRSDKAFCSNKCAKRARRAADAAKQESVPAISPPEAVSCPHLSHHGACLPCYLSQVPA